MRRHQIISGVGVSVVGLIMPCLTLTLTSMDAVLAIGYLWGTILLPFTAYLGYICGKYIRKMWCYPLIYSASLLGILLCIGHFSAGNILIFAGSSLLCIALMLFWGWFYKDLTKTE